MSLKYMKKYNLYILLIVNCTNCKIKCTRISIIRLFNDKVTIKTILNYSHSLTH